MSEPLLSIDDAIFVMRRNKTPLPTTFGPCWRDCGHGARGGGTCFDCARADLASHVGDELASDMADAIEAQALAYKRIMDAQAGARDGRMAYQVCGPAGSRGPR